VPLGRHALAHFTDGARISEVHGRELTERGRTLFPLYHPAAALRSTALRATLFEDARALGAAAAQL
jgi:uracil-DNA glycosylase